MGNVGFKPLDHEPTVAVKFFSAGTAACIADLFTFPLDVAKVRLQIQGEASVAVSLAQVKTNAVRYRGMFHTISTIAKVEGPKALWNGLVPGLQRQMCFASVRIGFYDSVKRFYMKILDVDGRHGQKNVPMRILAGITTGGAAVLCAQPTDVVKVRMQAPGGKQRYKGCIDAYRTIAQTEGVRGMWKGTLPNITRNAIVNAAELVSYDMIKETILQYKLLSDNFPCHFLSAFGAGFITTCCASPVDVVKTRFMNSGPGQYKGALHCAAVMFKEGGPMAFYKGFVPNYMRLGSWNIFTFVFFEQLKRGFSHMNAKINEQRELQY